MTTCARPNFMKAAPVLRALRAWPGVRSVLVHTGQHHDPAMSDRFFADLDLPQPDEWLGIHGGSHAEQTARRCSPSTTRSPARGDCPAGAGD